MAKSSNGRKFWIWILVTGGSILATICIAWATLSAEVEHQGTIHTVAIKSVKTEGCLPARQNKTTIEVLKEGQKTMNTKLDKIDSKMDELLKR